MAREGYADALVENDPRRTICGSNNLLSLLLERKQVCYW
jgi:hypothetical protein